jgi:hypothetical protein
MNILFVIKESYEEYQVRIALSEIAEPDSIYFAHSYAEAANFIFANIIPNQLVLDLIITQNNIDDLPAAEFLQRITKNKTATFSKGDFYFHTIPVVLIVDPEENRSAFLSDPFALVLNDIGAGRLHLFISELEGVVRDWRRQVFDDLANLGASFYRGRINYTHFLTSKRTVGRYTRIISDDFKMRRQRPGHQWILFDKRKSEIALVSYNHEIRRAMRSKEHDESRFHELFEQYPTLIRRDNFSDHWHEKPLPYGLGQSYKPDFSLKPNFNQLSDLSILEVKLPTEGFLAKTKFHTPILQSLAHQMVQVKDYQDYLESGQFEQELRSAYGFVPQRIQYNILIGRVDEKYRQLELLDKRMRQYDASHINLITHDEQLDAHSRYHDRMLRLHLL